MANINTTSETHSHDIEKLFTQYGTSNTPARGDQGLLTVDFDAIIDLDTPLDPTYASKLAERLKGKN